LRQLSIDAPIAALVGLGQCRTTPRRAESHGIKLGRLSAQAGFDVTQALAIGQLGKGHGTELLGATEVAHPAVAAITSHNAGKRSPRKEVHQLREQQLASVHRCLQRRSLESASRHYQIDTTQKRSQLSAHQMVVDGELVVNRTAVM
jgi:hypothetical protein